MPTEKTADQFIELIQKYIYLRPKMILPQHVVQFKKKMEGLKNKMDGAGSNPEDYEFLFRILILLVKSDNPLTMSELSVELNVQITTAPHIVLSLGRGQMGQWVHDPEDTCRRPVG